MVQTAVWKVKILKGPNSAMATLFAIGAQDKIGLEQPMRTTGRAAPRDPELETISSQFKQKDGGWALDLGRHPQPETA